MTSANVEACFLDAQETEAFLEWADDQPLDESPELPAECQRCGNEFGGGAVLVGERWVCTPCERPEYDDYEDALGEWAEAYVADLEEDRATQDDW